MIEIPSELIEPVAAIWLGRMWARYEEAKAAGDPDTADHWLRNLWFGMDGWNKVSIATSTATHFSIAVMNEAKRVADLIKHETGVDPWEEPGWKWRD